MDVVVEEKKKLNPTSHWGTHKSIGLKTPLAKTNFLDGRGALNELAQMLHRCIIPLESIVQVYAMKSLVRSTFSPPKSVFLGKFSITALSTFLTPKVDHSSTNLTLKLDAAIGLQTAFEFCGATSP